MFDWLTLFKKNNAEIKNNDSQIVYGEQAKNLIEKWMKLNGIEGISFDEYIKQLGLDFIDVINLESIDLNLSNPIWKNQDFMGVLCFKSKAVYTGYEEKFDLDGKSGAFVPTLGKLKKDLDINCLIYLYNNSLSAEILTNRRENGLRFKQSVKKDFTFDENMSLTETKDTVKISSLDTYYDEPRYQYEKTTDDGRIIIRVDDIKENTAINVNINGKIVDFDDVKMKSILWFPDRGDLKFFLSNILSYMVLNGEFTIKVDLVPGFSNIVYMKDKSGNITIKETNKKGNIYFTLENLQEENIFIKRLTVAYDKKRVKLDIVSTKEIDIQNLDKLVDYIYSKYDGIFGIGDCFNKISTISFKEPDDNLIRVELVEEYSGNIINSRVWSRNYQFDTDYTLENDSSMVLRK